MCYLNLVFVFKKKEVINFINTEHVTRYLISLLDTYIINKYYFSIFLQKLKLCNRSFYQYK